jgi:hypothetical protein
MGGIGRCANCGCADYQHKRNVYSGSGIYVAGTRPVGGIIARRLGKCWYKGCPGCTGWKRAPRPAAMNRGGR